MIDLSALHLPGMELLGFYDQPYRVQAERPHSIGSTPARPGTAATSSEAVVGRRSGQSLVASLWETTNLDESLLDWWKPGVVARRRLGGRLLSTSTIVITLLATALVAAVAWFALNRPGQVRAAAHSAVSVAADATLTSIGPLQRLADDLGADPAPDLSASTAVVLEAEGAARTLFESAGALDDEASAGIREIAVEASSGVLEATGQVNRLVAYRLAAEQALVPPVLETDPAAADIAAITETVAEWRANVAATLSQLPVGVLGGHRQLLDEWSAELQRWQEGYLDAMREGKPQAAANAVAAQTERLRLLSAELLQRLDRQGASIALGLQRAESALESLVGS